MAENEHKHEVRIHIDQKRCESPNPTTGDALYSLGRIPEGRVLYREVSGNREDEPVVRGPESVHLKEDDHFHSGDPRDVTIIVEGTPEEWKKPEISYVEVVTIFDPAYPQHPETTYSVKFKKGPRQNPEGILVFGASVKVKNGMVFNVSRTGQS